MSTVLRAISIRQPWAWLICQGFKNIENRNWPTSYRGRVLIHAARGMTRDEYEDGLDTARACGVRALPPPEQLTRGAIVGQAWITECVTADTSPWFSGKFGFVLDLAHELPAAPLRGQLGLFGVEWSDLPAGYDDVMHAHGLAAMRSRADGQKPPKGMR